MGLPAVVHSGMYRQTDRQTGINRGEWRQWESEAAQGGLAVEGSSLSEAQRLAGSKQGFLNWSRHWASSSALWDLGELLAESWSSPPFPQEALPSLAPWSPGLGSGSDSEAGEAPPRCRHRCSRPPPCRRAGPALTR